MENKALLLFKKKFFILSAIMQLSILILDAAKLKGFLCFPQVYTLLFSYTLIHPNPNLWTV